MKRILSSLLMLTMLLSALSLNFAVQADTQNTSEVYYYNDFTSENDLADIVFGVNTGSDPVIEDGAIKITKETHGVKDSTHMYLLKDDYIS